MNIAKTQGSQPTVLSHVNSPKSLETNIKQLADKIRERGDLPHITVTEQLEVLDELQTFSFGRFLIQNRGLDGYWTDVLLMHPEKGRQTNLNIDGQPLGSLENFLLNRAPTALATQERFGIFRAEIQKRVCDGAILASVPSGLMSDLLTLDYKSTVDITLYGVDIDRNSIQKAGEQAKACGLADKATFFESDAWKFSLPKPVDVLTSNGLNIYEPDENRVVDLYRQFYQNIKPGGILITSFLTPPPIPGSVTEWDLQSINSEDARLQRVLFVDVLGAAWQAYSSTEKTKQQLKDAGFENIEVISGKTGIFPTVIAKRLSVN